MAQGPDDENEILLQLATGLNSDLNAHKKNQLNAFVNINDMTNVIGSKERLIVVGSVVDGSKVNTPFEEGDVDVLIVSGNVELSEHLLQYVPDYPAYVTVSITDEHEEIFGNAESVGSSCLPASALQEMNKDKFYSKTFFLNTDLLPEKRVRYERLVKRSAVGLETKTMIKVLSDSDKVSPDLSSVAEHLISISTAHIEARNAFYGEHANKTEYEKKITDTKYGKNKNKPGTDPVINECRDLMDFIIKDFERLEENVSERGSREPKKDTVIYMREQGGSKDEVKERKDNQVDDSEPRGNVRQTSTLGDKDEQCSEKDKKASSEMHVSTEHNLLPEKRAGNVRLVKRSADGLEGKTGFRFPSDSDGGEKSHLSSNGGHFASLFTAFIDGFNAFKGGNANDTEKDQTKKTRTDTACEKDEKRPRTDPALNEHFGLLNVANKESENLGENASERPSVEPEEDRVINIRKQGHSKDEVKERKDNQVDDLEPQRNVRETAYWATTINNVLKKMKRPLVK